MKINPERREKLVTVLSDVLNRLCDRNDRFIVNTTPITRFHALRPPQITVKYYLQRIGKYSNCSEECFVLALIYIDRLIRTNTSFLVNSLNVHRLLITSMMLAAKFFDDQYFNNAYFGKVGGVTCKEINLLEIEFLFMINFNLFVAAGTFKTYNERLMMHSMPTESSEQAANTAANTHSPAPARANNSAPASAPAAPNPAPTAHQQQNTAPAAAPSSAQPHRNQRQSRASRPASQSKPNTRHRAFVPQNRHQLGGQSQTIPSSGQPRGGEPDETKDHHEVPAGNQGPPATTSGENFNRNAPSQGKPVRNAANQNRARHPHYGQRCTPPQEHPIRGDGRAVYTGQSR